MSAPSLESVFGGRTPRAQYEGSSDETGPATFGVPVPLPEECLFSDGFFVPGWVFPGGMPNTADFRVTVNVAPRRFVGARPATPAVRRPVVRSKSWLRRRAGRVAAALRARVDAEEAAAEAAECVVVYNHVRPFGRTGYKLVKPRSQYVRETRRCAAVTIAMRNQFATLHLLYSHPLVGESTAEEAKSAWWQATKLHIRLWLEKKRTNGMGWPEWPVRRPAVVFERLVKALGE